MANTEPSPLSPAQREIMEIVWEQGEVSVSEVRDLLAQRRELARNTVQTMMVRLEEKGWLKHRTLGRTFVYSANIPREASLGARVAQMVDRFFQGSPEAMVTALLEHRGLTRDEAQRIRAMIEQAESQLESKARKTKS
jgi:BlaI family transcriptional regulator, penicillinase repressor